MATITCIERQTYFKDTPMVTEVIFLKEMHRLIVISMLAFRADWSL